MGFIALPAVNPISSFIEDFANSLEDSAILYLVIAIGAMFFLPSLFSLVGYFMKGRQLGMYFPIVSLGSLLFGLNF